MLWMNWAAVTAKLLAHGTTQQLLRWKLRTISSADTYWTTHKLYHTTHKASESATIIHSMQYLSNESNSCSRCNVIATIYSPRIKLMSFNPPAASVDNQCWFTFAQNASVKGVHFLSTWFFWQTSLFHQFVFSLQLAHINCWMPRVALEEVQMDRNKTFCICPINLCHKMLSFT